MSDQPFNLASRGEGTVAEAGAVIVCPEAVDLGRDVTVAVLLFWSAAVRQSCMWVTAA
jgi:hypothetical protein